MMTNRFKLFGCVGAMLLSSWSLASPSLSQEQPAIDELALLQACAAGNVSSLPNPFPDLSPTDWAYEAVVKLYYCGAYRGAVSPETMIRYRQSRQPQDS